MRLFAIFCCFCFATTVSLKAQSGCIDGQVLDTNGNPIHSLNVLASKSSKGYTMEVGTDPNGRFSMTGLPAGEYQVFTSDETKAALRSVHFRTLDLSSAAQVQVADGDKCAEVTLRRALRS